MLLLASKISPAAEKRRSTAVDVAGAVRYLNMSFNANVTTIYCGYSILTESLFLARFWQSSKRDIRLFALRNEAVCYNSHNIEIPPIICFWGHA